MVVYDGNPSEVRRLFTIATISFSAVAIESCVAGTGAGGGALDADGAEETGGVLDGGGAEETGGGALDTGGGVEETSGLLGVCALLEAGTLDGVLDGTLDGALEGVLDASLDGALDTSPDDWLAVPLEAALDGALVISLDGRSSGAHLFDRSTVAQPDSITVALIANATRRPR